MRYTLLYIRHLPRITTKKQIRHVLMLFKEHFYGT